MARAARVQLSRESLREPVVADRLNPPGTQLRFDPVVLLAHRVQPRWYQSRSLAQAESDSRSFALPRATCVLTVPSGMPST